MQEIPAPRKLNDLGLSRSRLNERYLSSEKMASNSSIIEQRAVSNQEYMTKAELLMEENLESVSQRGDNRRIGDINGSNINLNDGQSDVLVASHLDFEYPDIGSRMDDDKSSYVKGQPRFVLFN